ncbi:hypothetical protein [Thermus phage TSP4]|nr:hypothetical protein [Thermus phage TSP4]
MRETRTSSAASGPTLEQLDKLEQLVADIIGVAKEQANNAGELVPVFTAFAEAALGYNIVFLALKGQISKDDPALKRACRSMHRTARAFWPHLSGIQDVDLWHLAYRLVRLLTTLAEAPHNKEVFKHCLESEVVLTHMMLTGAIQVITLTNKEVAELIGQDEPQSIEA